MNNPASNISGVPGGLYGSGGLTSSDTGLHPHWARITGKASGVNRYAHVQINDGSTADFTATLAESFGTAGTSDEAGYPAYELNGRTDVPVGAIVEMTPAGDLTFLVFTYTGTGDGTGTAAPCGGGCGSLLSAADHEDVAFALEILCNTGSFDHEDFAADFDGVAIENAQFRRTASGTWTYQYWKAATSTWTDWEINTGSVSGAVVLTFDATDTGNHGMPILRIDGVALRTVCDSADATFRGGPRNGFTGAGSAPAAGSCLPDDFAMRVSCACKWIDGFTGEGWYGVVAAEEDCETDTCTAVFLSAADGSACDDTIQICTDRYDTEAEADAVCNPPPVETECCAGDVPPTLGAEVTAACPELLNTTFTLTYQPGLSDFHGFDPSAYPSWTGTISGSDELLLMCVEVSTMPSVYSWRAKFWCDAGPGIRDGSFAADPCGTPLTGTITVPDHPSIQACCTGGITFTISPP